MSSGPFARVTRSLALATAIATVGSLGLAPLTADTAFAQGNSAGKGNGGGSAGGSSGGKDRAERRGAGSERAAQARTTGGVKRGALASELKGLNAAHASAQALASASPDSMPGRLAVFKESYQSVQDAMTAVSDAKQALLDERAKAVEGMVVGSQAYLDAITAFEASTKYQTLNDAIDAAETTLAGEKTAYQDSYLELTGGVDMSPEADAELLRLLGF